MSLTANDCFSSPAYPRKGTGLGGPCPLLLLVMKRILGQALPTLLLLIKLNNFELFAKSEHKPYLIP